MPVAELAFAPGIDAYEPSHRGEPILEVRNLAVAVDDGLAVENVDLSLEAGRTHCLVGESGCGKSLTCLALMGLLPPGARGVSGNLRMKGRSGAIPEKGPPEGLAMIYQDATASLDPLMTVGRQIVEALPADVPRRARRAEAEDLIAQVGIPHARARFESYPHELSGGMNQRIAIAIALAARPSVLLADEPTTALDVTVQARILDLMLEFQQSTGLAILFVTHDLGVVAQIAHDVSVMYCGEIVESGPVTDLFAAPRHPYSRGLVECLPRLSRQTERLESIAGIVPPLQARPTGCRFASRCTRADDLCSTQRPCLERRGNTGAVACFNPL
ncbi:ABC transporter ATP-binding protein [Mesorhizobium xinjiangense]|uniref:ABC transporter ATP-binding protein n=1 Tax=Mesorhizobium xinjiangense TaxID=2678685 RepID=UPI0012EDE37F|nr:ABC transporter ATP-binding protein [Mesorhizobium xinjiangense]